MYISVSLYYPFIDLNKTWFDSNVCIKSEIVLGNSSATALTASTNFPFTFPNNTNTDFPFPEKYFWQW